MIVSIFAVGALALAIFIVGTTVYFDRPEEDAPSDSKPEPKPIHVTQEFRMATDIDYLHKPNDAEIAGEGAYRTAIRTLTTGAVEFRVEKVKVQRRYSMGLSLSYGWETVYGFYEADTVKAALKAGERIIRNDRAQSIERSGAGTHYVVSK